MKNLKKIILISSIAYLIYFVSSIIYNFIKFSSHQTKKDFTYVEKSEQIHIDDSLYLSNAILAKLKLLYTAKYNSYNYLSLFLYGDNYLFVRKLDSKKMDLMKNFKIIRTWNTTDNIIKYDMEEIPFFYYKVDVERKHGLNKNLLIDGYSVKILKHNKDTIVIDTELYNFSIGKKDEYINEGLYMINEKISKKPIHVKFMIFNREGNLYLYLLFNKNGGGICDGSIEKIR